MNIYSFTNTITNIVAVDTAIYDKMYTDFSHGNYPIDAPFWRRDPYQASPLSGQAGVQTPTPTVLTVSVSAPGCAAITHTFDDTYRTDHFFPVLGLCSGVDNTVSFTTTDQLGQSLQSEFTVPANCIPLFPTDAFGQVDIIAPPVREHLNSQLYITNVSNSFPAAIDYDGNVRWYIYETTAFTCFRAGPTAPVTATLYVPLLIPLNNGHILTKSQDQRQLIEFDQLGRIYTITELAYPDETGQSIPCLAIRDMIQMPPGDDRLLIQTENDSTMTRTRANQTEGDVLAIMDFNSGQVQQTVDYKTLLDVNRRAQPPSQQDASTGRLDWFHANGIHYHVSTNSFINSGRNQGVIVATDQTTNEIKWMLGSHTDWNTGFSPYLLTPLRTDGTPYDLTDPADSVAADHEFWPWGQHGVRALPDAYTTPGGDLDLLVFDDGAYRSLSQPDAIVSYNNWSRAVRYNINITNMTARIVWQYGKDLGDDYYCGYVGNVQFMPDTSSMMINFGGTNCYVDPGTGDGRNVGIRGDVLMADFPPNNFNDPDNFPVNEKTKVQEVSTDTGEILFEFWQYNRSRVGVIQNFSFKVWKADLYDFSFTS